MRLPILLMLAVIIFTPANLREVAADTIGQLQAAMQGDKVIRVAARHDTAKNSVGNIR